jgi:hypothetical protein
VSKVTGSLYGEIGLWGMGLRLDVTSRFRLLTIRGTVTTYFPSRSVVGGVSLAEGGDEEVSYGTIPLNAEAR